MLTASIWAQNTIRVPQDQPTIQAGIDAAQSGDTVLVAPGTYVENVNFNGKVIIVTSSTGPASTTIDGGGASAPVVAIPFGGSPGLPGPLESELSGFTVRNGGAGGIVVTYSSPTIRNNIIVNNISPSNPNSDCGGAGIQLYNSSAVIEDNTISNNSAVCDRAAGGGIGIAGEGSPQIRRNTINNNQAITSSQFISTYGGGIAVASFGGNSTPVISNNIIKGNQGSMGGGIFVGFDYVSPVIVQNLVVENTGVFGAGLAISYVQPNGSVVLTSNTIANNQGPVGAIYLNTFFDFQASFVNNLIIASGSQRALDCSSNVSMPTVQNNDIFSAAAPGDWGNCSDQTGTNGNIASDPLFANVSQSDYHLQPNSPAIDRGNNSAPNLQQNDFDGNPRIADGDNDGTSTADIGAYEIPGSAVAFSPNSLDFGDQVLGSWSVPRSATLVNRGSNAIQLLRDMTGDTQDFGGNDDCPFNFPAGASCTFNITFAPNTLGNRAANLTAYMWDGQQAQPLAVLSLTGRGVNAPAPQTQLTPTPSSLSFAAQRVGTTSAPQTVYLSESGPPLVVNSVSVTGPFNQVMTCSQATAPACRIQVTFTPTTRGSVSGALTIHSNASGSPHTVSLSGLGIAPVATLSPVSLAFGNQLVGTSSSSQAVTLTNSGDADLQVSTITTSGDFTQTNACGTTLSPAASCTINLTFAPTVTGQRSGTLTISSNSFGSAPAVNLTGTGVAPMAAVSPNALSFTNQLVGTTSASQTVTLSNTGTATLHLSGLNTTGDFSQSNTCGTEVAPGANCAVSVTFIPSATGSRAGTLTIASDSSEPLPTVSLSGTGTAPMAAMSPNALSFASQLVGSTSASQTVTLSNSGTATLTITGFPMTGDFSQTNSCGSSLAPGGSCVVNVTFTPSASGTRNGSLSVSSNTFSAAPVVPLSGTGVVPVASVAPATLAFGTQLLNTTSAAQPVTLTNTGGATLHIAAVSASGDFAQSNACGTQLPPGGSCTINVTFRPTGTGSRSGTLNVSSDSSIPAPAVSLSGTGATGAPTLSPTSLAFGNQRVGTQSVSKTVKVTANGPGPLTIFSIATSGDFLQTNTCPASLNASSSCSIKVYFRPTAVGTRTGQLTITDNGLGSPRSVALSGTGKP